MPSGFQRIASKLWPVVLVGFLIAAPWLVVKSYKELRDE